MCRYVYMSVIPEGPEGVGSPRAGIKGVVSHLVWIKGVVSHLVLALEAQTGTPAEQSCKWILVLLLLLLFVLVIHNRVSMCSFAWNSLCRPG